MHRHRASISQWLCSNWLGKRRRREVFGDAALLRCDGDAAATNGVGTGSSDDENADDNDFHCGCDRHDDGDDGGDDAY